MYAGIPVTLIMDNYQDETVNRLYDIDKHKYSKTCLIQCLCNLVQCVIRLLFSFLFHNNPIFPPCNKKKPCIFRYTLSLQGLVGINMCPCISKSGYSFICLVAIYERVNQIEESDSND